MIFAKTPLALLTFVITAIVLNGCATTPETPKLTINPSFTGTVQLANTSGKRADQVARSVESEFIRIFPSGTITTSKSSAAPYAIDLQVNEARLNQTSANREEKNCARYSDPDPKAQGFIAQALSRKCLSWETKIIPCTLNNYELDVQLRIGDSQKRPLVSDRKVFQQNERVCQGSTSSPTNLMAKTEQDAGQWVISLLSKTISMQTALMAQNINPQSPTKQPQAISQPGTNNTQTPWCEPPQRIKFADGSMDCMSNLSFFNQTFDKNKAAMISFADEKGKIAIAFSRDFKACPLSTINWSPTSSWALETCNKRIKNGAKNEKINPDNCQCEILVEGGESKFSRQEFRQKTDEYLAVRGARLLANKGENPSQAIPAAGAPATPVLNPTTSTSSQTAKSVYALVIGNGKYKNAGLTNPVNDAMKSQSGLPSMVLL